MAQLGAPDRSWLVAGLTLAGLTADDIADRLACSLRLVRTIRAHPMTAVCQQVQNEARAFTDELRLVRTELTAARLALARAVTERDRARAQVARTLAAAPDTCRSGAHLMTPYNTYLRADGRRMCRACHRDRSTAYRRQHGTTQSVGASGH
jgi:hypothetical protein